jgi:hypothetical protein
VTRGAVDRRWGSGIHAGRLRARPGDRRPDRRRLPSETKITSRAHRGIRVPRPDRAVRFSAVSLVAPIVLGVAALGSACVASEAGEHVGENGAPIINGKLSGVEDDATIWLGILNADGYPVGACSGSLLADNLVLTARHCVSRTIGEGVICSRTGTVKAGSGGTVTRDYAPSTLAVLVGPRMKNKADAKGKALFVPEAKHLCNSDIALLVLDRHIPDAKIAKIRLDAPPVEGETITAVGFGVSNTSGRGRKRRAGIPILAVGPAMEMGPVAPNEFAIGEGICSGDSGGPAFADSTGAILGVVSRGGNGADYDPSKDPEYVQCLDAEGVTTRV